MTLSDYLRSTQQTDAAFAEIVGVDRSTIARIRKGELNTTRDVMARIIEASGGVVTADDLVFPARHGSEDSPPAPAQSPDKAGANIGSCDRGGQAVAA